MKRNHSLSCGQAPKSLPSHCRKLARRPKKKALREFARPVFKAIHSSPARFAAWGFLLLPPPGRTHHALTARGAMPCVVAPIARVLRVSSAGMWCVPLLIAGSGIHSSSSQHWPRLSRLKAWASPPQAVGVKTGAQRTASPSRVGSPKGLLIAPPWHTTTPTGD